MTGKAEELAALRERARRSPHLAEAYAQKWHAMIERRERQRDREELRVDPTTGIAYLVDRDDTLWINPKTRTGYVIAGCAVQPRPVRTAFRQRHAPRRRRVTTRSSARSGDGPDDTAEHAWRVRLTDGRAYLADDVDIDGGVLRLAGRRLTPDGRLLDHVELVVPARALRDARRTVEAVAA